MRRYEIVVDADGIDGHQIFACWAESEEHAEALYHQGKCEIIEVALEVVSLGDVLCVEESEDIESRLPQDIYKRDIDALTLERDRFKESLVKMVSALELVSNEFSFTKSLHDCVNGYTEAKLLLGE